MTFRSIYFYIITCLASWTVSSWIIPLIPLNPWIIRLIVVLILLLLTVVFERPRRHRRRETLREGEIR